MSNLGLVAAGPRNIKPGTGYEKYFSAPGGGEMVIKKNGSVEDTVRFAGRVVKDYAHQTEKIARVLEGNSLPETLRNIFDFSYNHIQYHRDRAGIEELRTPWRTWQDRKNGVDCDDYTIFVSSILYNLNIPFTFRITKYDGKQQYQHIYVIVPTPSGHITVDPVVDTYNYEKPYSDHRDFTQKNLGLMGLEEEYLPDVEELQGLDIAVLSGLGEADLAKMTEIAIGADLDQALQGLGSQESTNEALYKYMVKTRNLISANPNAIPTLKNPTEFVKMLNYAIQYWNTPQRDMALDILADQEQKLIDQGVFLVPSDPEDELDGFDEEDELEDEEWEPDYEFSGVQGEDEDPEFEYLYEEEELGKLFSRSRRKARRAKRKKRRTVRRTKRAQKKAKHGGFFKRVGKAAKKAGKKIAHAVVRFNPITIAARGGLLLFFRLNMKKRSDVLKYSYLSEAQAKALNVDMDKYRSAVKAREKVEKLFVKALKGKKANLRKAILAKNRGKSVGLKGVDGTESIEGIEGLGFVVSGSTGAAIAAASPFIVKVAGFLKKLGLDKAAGKMIKRSAAKRTLKQSGDKNWRKTWREVKKQPELTYRNSPESQQVKQAVAQKAANTAENIITQSTVPNAAKGGSLTPVNQTTSASIIPTGIMDKATQFIKTKPLQAGILAGGIAYLAIPGVRNTVNGMFGAGRKPVSRKRSPSALSGVPNKRASSRRRSTRVKSISLT